MNDLASAVRRAAATVVMPAVGRGRQSAAVAPWSIRFLRSPVFRSMTRSAVQVLARITVELANGRNAVTHRAFQNFGVDRGGITAAIVELEALSVIVVERRAAKANAFDLSERWRNLTIIEQATGIRDRARHFGITRRRKIERASKRIDRERRLEWLTAALNAPHMAPALAGLDDVALAVLTVIVDAIAHSAGAAAISYDRLTDATGVGRNAVAASLHALAAQGLIEVAHGKRGRNVYKVGEWRGANTTHGPYLIESRQGAST